jgi:hypothetical protein
VKWNVLYWGTHLDRRLIHVEGTACEGVRVQGMQQPGSERSESQSWREWFGIAPL